MQVWGDSGSLKRVQEASGGTRHAWSRGQFLFRSVLDHLSLCVSLQLRKPRGLSQPVVLIRGHDAELLMGVVNKNREAHVKIEVKEPPAWVRDTPFPLPSVSFLPSCCAMEQDFPKDAELSSPGMEITALHRSCLSAAFR